MTTLPLSRLLRLAARFCWRDARAGELHVLFFAILIAVASCTAIGYFGGRLNDAMERRASEFLGADLVLRGSRPADAGQIQQGLDAGLQYSQVVEFSSVIVGDSGVQLSSIKAVDDAYPLRGELRSASTPQGDDEAGGRPAPGQAWAEARLLALLDLKVGDTIEVGRRALVLSRVLTEEPDRGSDLYSLNPHVLINLADLESTGVVQPGSRVRYRALWRGDLTQLDAYREQVTPSLAPNQRLQDVREGNRQLGGALGRAERYLNLASLAAVILAGVAVALSANRFASRRFDASALLRCLGMSRRETLALYSLQLAMTGLVAGGFGVALGYAGQAVLFWMLDGLIPPDLPVGGITPAIAGLFTGWVALTGFAVPPLAALGKVPPLRVLRSDLHPVPPSTWFVYGAALLGLALVMWRLSLDLRLTLSLLAGGVVAALTLGGLMLLGLNALRRLLARASLGWRLGLGQLLRRPMVAAGQSLAFGLILMCMALVALLRGELLDTWQDQLPSDAPNVFAINIVPGEREAFAARVRSIAGGSAPIYPMVAGRLVAHDGAPISESVTEDSRGERATRRDLNLTWSEGLPPDNQVVAGQWWDGVQSTGEPQVSVEAELAESLGLEIGDRLGFEIGGTPYQAQVTSFREIDWNNFRPNFFVIFQPGALQDLPVTYITSFYLPGGSNASFVELARAFPTVTLLDVNALLTQLREILRQVSLAVEFVLLFVLAAGLAVLFAGLQATIDERVRQDAVLRALGARGVLLRNARRAEFALLGACSGVLAAVGCELITFLLYRHVFGMQWHAHPWLLVLPFAGAILIAGAGTWGTRRALHVSPLQVLREG